MDKAIKHYIVKLVNQTRTYSSIQLGASPRGSIALMKASQAYAFIHGRNYVIPDDVKFLAPYVLAHRLILKMEAKFEGITGEQVIAKNRCTNYRAYSKDDEPLMKRMLRALYHVIKLLLLPLCLVLTFMYAMFQGGFVSWFLFLQHNSHCSLFATTPLLRFTGR